MLEKITKTKTTNYTNTGKEKIELKEKTSIKTILKRTDVEKQNIFKLSKTTQEELPFLDRAMVEVKYSGYIEKQKREVLKNKSQDLKPIPKSLNYKKITGLSNEVVEKFIKSQPATVGSASRIEGALSLIHI